MAATRRRSRCWTCSSPSALSCSTPPSGAGKTSLLQAGLIPALEAEGFRVLPTMRVNSALPGPAASRAANRYTLSCLLSLEEAQPETAQRPLDELAGLSLNGYLASHAGQPTPDAAPWHGDLLIFDQFEEVLTLDPTDRPGKLAFFEQVGEALRNRSRWAIFAMREEFIAGLDPYLKPIPTRFDKGRRFRLELLSPAAALSAMQQPARLAGVEFTDAAAARLVEDLAAVRVQQPDGSTVAAAGDAVEPVQLQVVCWRLWERLAADDASIDLDDLAAIGDVDAALRSYYAETVAAVAKATGVSERAVRDWVEERLITGQEIRSQVLQGVDASEGLPNAAIWRLVDAHLLRAEQRRGATWFELAHDRLMRPVREDNAAWREVTLSPLQRAALRWQQQGKPALSAHLLAAAELAQAEQWAKSHPDALSALDREFLAASQETQRRQRMRRRLRIVGSLAAILLALTLLATGKLLYDFNAARQQNRSRAVAAQARNVQYSQPDLSLLLSVEALSLARRQDSEIDAALLAVLDDNPQLEQVIHTGVQPIQSLAVSPDGSLLAAGDDAGQIRLWDRQQAAELEISPLASESDSVTEIAMAPQRPLLAVADKRGGVTLWDLAGSWPVRAAPTPMAEIDGATRVFWPSPQPPSPSPPPHRSNQAHRGQVNGLAFSPDGTQLATVGRNEALLWRVDGLTLRDPVPLEQGQPTWSVAFGPDGDTVAVGRADGTIVLHSLSSAAAQTLTGDAGAVAALSFSPDGRYLAAGVNTRGVDRAIGVVQIWNLATARNSFQVAEAIAPEQTLRNFTDAVESVRFSDDSQVLASAGRDGAIHLWSMADGVPLSEPLHGHLAWVNDLAFAPGPLTLYSAGSRGEINQWLLGRRTRLGEPLAGHTDQVWRVAFSPNSGLLASGGRDGVLRLWDMATRAGQNVEQRSDALTAVAFSPDGRQLAAGGKDGAVTLHDGAPGTLTVLPGRNWITALAYNPRPGAAEMATADADNRVLLWDLSAAPAVSSTLTANLSSRVASLVFDQQGQRLMGGDAQGHIFQWDVQRGELVEQASLPSALPVAGLATDPSGKLLAAASHDNAIYLRRLPGLQPAGGGVLVGHTRPVNAVAFHPDGRLLASAGSDGAIILWDLATQQQLGSPLIGHDGPVNAVAFSLDGQWLVSAGDDQQVILWPMTRQAWTAKACHIVGRPLSPAEIEQYLDGQAAHACRD
jgi:WD40 repeat protein